MAQYGIYAGNAAGAGSISNSYASNMAASAFYVGACRRICDTVLSDDHGTSSAIGYLGTNSGGRLLITHSVFDDNRTGVAPTSLNSDDAPPPHDGRCPGSVTKSCTIIEHNVINNNNNVNAPVNGISPAVGVGVELDGAEYDTVRWNTIAGNGSWGVIANDSVDRLGSLPIARCQGGFRNVPQSGLCLIPARGNAIYSNIFSEDGTFGNVGDADLATVALTAGSAAPRNCFYANYAKGGALTSTPPGIEESGIDGEPCGSVGTGGDAILLKQLVCATISVRCEIPGSKYSHRTMISLVPIPVLPSMPAPCSGIPRNPFCNSRG